jgi:hypothetical protein
MCTVRQVTALPLRSILCAVALADGLAQRAIRRVSGGRESAGLYHRAKHFEVVVFASGVAVTLLCPGPMDLVRLWVPIAVFVTGLALVQWSFYRTHL